MDVYLNMIIDISTYSQLDFSCKKNMHLQSKEKSVGNLWWNHCFIATFDYSYKLLDIHLAKINWLLMDFKIWQNENISLECFEVYVVHQIITVR